mmetsp:Transcript_116808/g.183681  ORF Transcript_116808/g.183681 Transcript_116808/m.183681 type:complete len:262 (+) Transcript_116808:90-875(+)
MSFSLLAFLGLSCFLRTESRRLNRRWSNSMSANASAHLSKFGAGVDRRLAKRAQSGYSQRQRQTHAIANASTHLLQLSADGERRLAKEAQSAQGRRHKDDNATLKQLNASTQQHYQNITSLQWFASALSCRWWPHHRFSTSLLALNRTSTPPWNWRAASIAFMVLIFCGGCILALGAFRVYREDSPQSIAHLFDFWQRKEKGSSDIEDQWGSEIGSTDEEDKLRKEVMFEHVVTGNYNAFPVDKCFSTIPESQLEDGDYSD